MGTLGRHWADNGQTLGRHWADIGQTLGRHWADIGQTLESSIFPIKLSVLLMQDESFQFSHVRSDFLVLLSEMRLSSYLIQDKTFRFPYPR